MQWQATHGLCHRPLPDLEWYLISGRYHQHAEEVAKLVSYAPDLVQKFDSVMVVIQVVVMDRGSSDEKLLSSLFAFLRDLNG